MQGHNVRIEPTARTVPDRPTEPTEAEAKTCGTCYWYEPCPCNRCGWGYCNRGTRYDGYMPEDSICGDWEEA